MQVIPLFKIHQAIDEIQAGKIIAYPTEAVYGLGCDPLNEEAVFNLLRLKKRPMEKGLILIAASLSQLKPYLELTDEIITRVQATWPGPVTWIIPSQSWVPNWITGNHSSIAVRVTAHPLARLLCEKNRVPIISTSANTSSNPPATHPWMVSRQFSKNEVFVLTGQVGNLKQATPIYDVLSQQKMR